MIIYLPRCGVLLNLVKEFDTVNTYIIIQKLDRVDIKISTFKLFKSEIKQNT